MMLRFCGALVLGMVVGLASAEGQEKEKPNLSFGKTQNLAPSSRDMPQQSLDKYD